MRIRNLLGRIHCRLKGHVVDWKEYDRRIEKEGHHAHPSMLFCSRCKRYEVIRDGT